MDMLENLKRLEAKIKKALDQFADELKFQRDFRELETYSNTVLDSTREIIDIYLYVDLYPLVDKDFRLHEVCRKRAVEIRTSFVQAEKAVKDLDLVEYVKAVKKMIHQVTHLIQLTEKYIELGELPKQKERPKVTNKRYKIEEQFDEWREWVRTYRKDLAYYEPLAPFVEDSERQTRLAELVKKLKKSQKGKSHGQ
jgi:hypothetical protein